MEEKAKKKFKVKREAKSVDFNFEAQIDIDNEQLVLGSLLNFPELVNAFSIYTDYRKFQAENHKCIAWTISNLRERGIEATPDTINANKSQYPGTKHKVDIRYLNELRKTFTEEHSIDAYKSFVDKLNRDAYKKQVRETTLVDLYNKLNNPHSSIEQVQGEVERIGKTLLEYDGSGLGGFKQLSEIDAEYQTHVEKRAEGFTFGATGFKQLDDELTVGFGAGKISIIAGRPGMAKSALVANCMHRLGNLEVPNAQFSLEMSDISMYDRLVAIRSSVPLEKIIKKPADLETNEKIAIKSARKALKDLPVYIDDTPTMTLEKMEMQLTKLCESVQIKVVFIDLFMKVQKPKWMAGKSTADQYTEMLNYIQRMAKTLDLHICIVVQIGRRAEQRGKDKRPQLSDLKDSGAYEEVADLVMLLYREAYYKRGKSMDKHVKFSGDKLEIHIAKQREGKMNHVVEMSFVDETTKIEKMSDKRRDEEGED